MARIINGDQDVLPLGNLNAKRDWGFSGDYVEGMWRILQQDKPGDYVLASGETHSVREFAELAFKEVGIELEWRGTGVNEKGFDKKTGRIYVEVNPKYFRPAEVELLWGDPSRAEKELGWKRKTSFRELVHMMVDADMKDITGKNIEEYLADAEA